MSANSQQAIPICTNLEHSLSENGVQIGILENPRMSTPKRKKAAKGSVVVQVFKDRLRLRWSHQGTRYYLYLGLADSKVNRIVAEGRARLIEGDLATGNFDPTLAKYKPENQRVRSLSVAELFEQFTKHKAKQVYKRTLAKYRAMAGHLSQFFRGKTVEAIGDAEAEDFRDWLVKRLAPITVRERLTLLRACWTWAIKHKLAAHNPWTEIRVKVPPKQKSKPFTLDEIERILQGFRDDRHYSHYADFIEFLFGTGCRTGEAIALQWQHLNQDCSVVWIGESWSRGERKATKTNQARYITLTDRLQQMLLARRPDRVNPKALVFPSPKGLAIDDHNFRNRAWKSVLVKLSIPYRKPYTTRHTLVSHALDVGMSPAAIAELTGHTIETLFRDYAGNVQSRPKLPELW